MATVKIVMTMITMSVTMETMALMASAVASSPLGLTTTEEPKYLVVVVMVDSC